MITKIFKNKARNEGTARILAATLTLIAREYKTLAPPFSLWNPILKGKEIKDIALEVANGKSQAVWVEETHPVMGLLVMRKRELESELLGYASAQLKGPYLVDPDPISRQKKTVTLLTKAKEVAKALSYGFISVKSTQDPAIIRGFIEEGFTIAEVGSCLQGPITEPSNDPKNTSKTGNLVFITPGAEDINNINQELGELFYDGHHFHSPFLPEGFSKNLWAKIVERDIQNANPSLMVIDKMQNRIIGLAIANVVENESALTILHVNESRRKEGLGRELLESLIKIIYEKGGRTLYVETASYNIPALNLYLSIGLRPIAPNVSLHFKI
jgi:GNAT superfamily N-acetyltransferase